MAKHKSPPPQMNKIWLGLGVLLVLLIAAAAISKFIQQPSPPLTAEASEESRLCQGKSGKTCEIENSVNDTLATTNLVNPNDNKKYLGFIGGGDLVDYWKVNLSVGSKYQAVLVKDDNDRPGQQDKPGDSGKGNEEIRLYDGTTPVLPDNNKIKTNSFTITASDTKAYFIKISPGESSGKSRYQFTFKDLTDKPADKIDNRNR